MRQVFHLRVLIMSKMKELYSIEEALKEQIKYCHELSNYRCGFYINKLNNRKFIVDEMRKLLEQDCEVEKIINNSFNTEIHFKNGSSLRVIRACDNARGHKNHGVIIDHEIDMQTINNIIMPSMMPRRINEFDRESWEEVKKRIMYCVL